MFAEIEAATGCLASTYELTLDESELLKSTETAIGLELHCPEQTYSLWAFENGHLEVASMRAHLRGSGGPHSLSVRQRLELQRPNMKAFNAIGDYNDCLAWAGLEMPMDYTDLVEDTSTEPISDPKWPLPPAHIFDLVAYWWTSFKATVDSSGPEFKIKAIEKK